MPHKKRGLSGGGAALLYEDGRQLAVRLRGLVDESRTRARRACLFRSLQVCTPIRRCAEAGTRKQLGALGLHSGIVVVSADRGARTTEGLSEKSAFAAAHPAPPGQVVPDAGASQRPPCHCAAEPADLALTELRRAAHARAHSTLARRPRLCAPLLLLTSRPSVVACALLTVPSARHTPSPP